MRARLLFACHETCDEGQLLGGSFGMIGGGAAIGAILASPTPEEVVYSSTGTPGARFAESVAPIISSRQKGATLTLFW